MAYIYAYMDLHMHPLVNCCGWGLGSCCKLRETAARGESHQVPRSQHRPQCSWLLPAGRFACSCQDRWLITLPGLEQDRLHLLYLEIWWLAQGFCWFFAKQVFPTGCIPASHLAPNSSSSVYVGQLKLCNHPIAEQFWLALGASVQKELGGNSPKVKPAAERGQSHFIYGH